MSENILNYHDLQVTRFWGGTAKGQCIQITTNDGYVQLTKADFFRVLESVCLDISQERLWKGVPRGMVPRVEVEDE